MCEVYTDEIYDFVPTLTANELEQQLSEHIKFLELVHPFLKEEGYHKECVELRPIRRSGNKYIRSFNLWRSDKQGIERLKKYLTQINSEPVCLYYSVFNLDYKKITKKPDGKQYQKGCLNEGNAMYTTTLVMDFDKIEFKDYIKYKNRLEDIGIKTITVFTGHGFQDLILLSQKVYDKKSLRNFTELLLRKGFDVDPAIVDCARVMRMPYSFNCKELDNKNSYHSKNNPKVIKTALVDITEKRYAIKDVFSRIGNLPDNALVSKLKVVNFDKLMGRKKAGKKTAEVKNEQTDEKKLSHANKEDNEEKGNEGKIKIKDIKQDYKNLDFQTLPIPIQKMLTQTKKDFRNKVLLFLVPFFRNTIGLDLKRIKNIMVDWGKNCIPALSEEFVISEVERIYKYNFRGKYGKYDESLAREFGYIEFDKYRKNNKVIIPNDFFEAYSTISDTAVRIYLAMRTFEKIEGISEWTKEDIARVAQITGKTFYRNIEDLIKSGFIDKRRGKKREREGYKYFINKFFNRSKGYTSFPVSTLENMLSGDKRLTNGEMKLYTYLCHMVGGGNSECFASQEYLANKINKKRNSVSEMTGKLHFKRYIRKETEEDGPVLRCTYTLIY